MQASPRIKAFLFHLVFSIAVGLVSSWLVFSVWYPDVFASISGVTDIFLLLLAVDMTLGPLITLIIFNIEKKELKRDIAIIVLIQLFALGYGLHTVFSARPVYIAFTGSQFDMVYANNLSKASLAKVTNEEFKVVPWWGPKLVSAQLPENEEVRKAIVMNAIQGDGTDVQEMPEYYNTYDADRSLVASAAKPLDRLEARAFARVGMIDEVRLRYKSGNIELGFLQLQGKTAIAYVIVNKSTGDFLETLNLDR